MAFDKKCRKVIDSDSKRHWLFLDDLHEHEEGEVMTRVFGASHQEDYVIALTSSPLSVAIPSSIRFSSFFLALLSIGGRWAYKTSIEGTCISLLWISEARWKGNIKACKECIERFSPPPLWSALCAYMDKNNGVAYPDVVEFYVDGRIELSVAFLL